MLNYVFVYQSCPFDCYHACATLNRRISNVRVLLGEDPSKRPGAPRAAPWGLLLRLFAAFRDWKMGY